MKKASLALIKRVVRIGFSLNKLAVAFIASSLILYAADITVSHNFVAGTTISSSQVNKNFSELVNAINEIRNNVNRVVLEANMSNPSALTIPRIPMSNDIDVPVDVATKDIFLGFNSSTNSYDIKENGFYYAAGVAVCEVGGQKYYFPLAVKLNGKNYLHYASLPSTELPLLKLSAGDTLTFSLAPGGSLVGGANSPGSACQAESVDLLIYKKGF